MKYQVTKTCHGFRNRLWREGQIVNIDDNAHDVHLIPKWFTPTSSMPPKPEVIYDPIPISKMGRTQNQNRGALSQTVEEVDARTLKPVAQVQQKTKLSEVLTKDSNEHLNRR